jgi:hypothetical protein
MTYNPNIPMANDIISQSQSQILTNFSQCDTLFDVDHVKFSDVVVPANRGMHRQVTFQNVIADPGQANPIATAYTKTDPSTGKSELFFQNDTLAANVVQLTGLPTTLPTVPSGFLKFPNGIILKWGNVGLAAGASFVTYPVAVGIPVFTQVLSIQITNCDAGGTPNTFAYLRDNVYGTTGFNAFSCNRTSTGTVGSTINYLAIGY